MYSKYIRVLAIVLATMFIVAGCSLVTITKPTEQTNTEAANTAPAENTDDQPADETPMYDDNTVVAEFTGGTILRGRAMSEYADVVEYYESYGYALDDDATIEAIKTDILDYLCEMDIVKAKADELNLTTVTDEEKAALEKQATEEFEEVVGYYKMFFEGDNDEQTRADVVEYLAEQGYTLDSLKQSLVDGAWEEKLKDYVTKDITIDDEAIKAQYDDLVAADQESYNEDPYSYEYAAMSGETISWYPEGYRRVKHILIPFTDEQVESLSEKQMQIEDVGYYIDEIDWQAENPDEAGAEDMIIESDGEAEVHGPDDGHNHDLEAVPEPEGLEDEEFDDSELFELDFEDESGYGDMTREQLVAERDKLTSELKTMQDEYFQGIAATVKEVQDKIAAGEDFDALIAQYGADEGMTVEPGLSMGYLVSANTETFEESFTKGAMALVNVGDVSEPIMGTNGCHIIKYVTDVTPGAVPFEQMRDSVEKTALEVAREDMYYDQVSKWVAEANVVTYPERMN